MPPIVSRSSLMFHAAVVLSEFFRERGIRRLAALHDAIASLHVPKAPYTARQRPYTRQRRLARCDSSLTRPKGLLQFKCSLNYEGNVSRTGRGAADAVL